MLPLTQNEIAALQIILQFVSLKDLLFAAQTGFDEGDSVISKENADLCYKAMKAFLD